MRWVEIFLKYYFEIKYIKGLNNARVDVFSWWVELQETEKPLGAILKLYKDKKN